MTGLSHCDTPHTWPSAWTSMVLTNGFVCLTLWGPQFTSDPLRSLISLWSKQHLLFSSYLVYLQKLCLPKHWIHKFPKNYTYSVNFVLKYSPKFIVLWKPNQRNTNISLTYLRATMFEMISIQSLFRTVCTLIKVYGLWHYRSLFHALTWSTLYLFEQMMSLLPAHG